MSPKAATALLMALTSIQLSTGTLLAKPTHTLARPAARRLIAVSPAPHLSRERIAHPPVGVHSRPHDGLAERHAAIAAGSRVPRNNSVSRRSRPTQHESVSLHTAGRLGRRHRTLAQYRFFASQAAIASADGGLRPGPRPEPSETRTTRSHRARYIVQNAARNAFPRLRDSDPPLRFTDRIATGDEPPAPFATVPSSLDPTSGSNVLSNVGGVLRPALGTPPLKSIEDEASTPVLLPALRVTSLYDSSGRLIVPPPLYGSREILLHQNEMADRDGLIRVRNDADLLNLRREKKLVALPDNETLRVDFRLPENRRFSRPWTVAFLAVLARDYYESFHSPLQVDSAVRTVAVQQRLLRTNGNAAPSTGDTASPHLTGQAVDIAKGGLSRTQIAWMRTYLQPLIDLGKIDVEEEFQQSCFHISVYKNFVPTAPTHFSVAATHPLAPAILRDTPTE